MSEFLKVSKTRTRRARCKWVLVILFNRMEIAELLREAIHPPVNDLPDASLKFAVVRSHGLEVFASLESVILLGRRPAEPKWIRDPRAKVEKELVSASRSRVKSGFDAERAEDRAGNRTARTQTAAQIRNSRGSS